MALSGSTNFELDVTEYIEEAFERCGLEVRTGYDLKTAKRSLNLMLAEWANRGLNQWTIIETSVPLATGIAEYPAGTLTMTVSSSSGFSIAETITGGTSGATASVTSLPSSTTIAITIPSGTFSSGETITGGTSSASTSLSAVVDFSDVRKTIDFLSAVVTRDSTDLSITRVSRDSFLSIPSKATTGRPSQFFIERQTTPVLKVWPTPENNTDVIKFTRLTRMNDADTMTNTVDMPFRFYPCLAAGLAYYIAMKRAPNKIQLLKAVYEEEFERAMTEDRDRSSFQVAPSLDYYAVY
jgi:hypothetical protein|tara:strand:+ start:884 stop:1771 length:888 start_codon:yes stop_codon:yes gene_type:complete